MVFMCVKHTLQTDQKSACLHVFCSTLWQIWCIFNYWHLFRDLLLMSIWTDFSSWSQNNDVRYEKGALWFLILVFCGFRGAQFERPLPVSSGAVHTANHRVPWLRSKHRWRSSQCSPQCTAVPQNHGRREVMSLGSVLQPHEAVADLHSGRRKHFCDEFK